MTKSNTNKSGLSTYVDLLGQIKTRIRQGQIRSMTSANAEMIQMYWEIGQMIYTRQKNEGWGAGVLPRLAKDLQNELSDVKGFSTRNLRFMVRFYKEYHWVKPMVKQPVSLLDEAGKNVIGQQAVAQLEEMEKRQLLVTQIPWGHNVILMQRVKDRDVRFWYMQQVLEQGWGRDTLGAMIKSNAYKRCGKITSNFKTCLPSPQSELVQQA